MLYIGLLGAVASVSHPQICDGVQQSAGRIHIKGRGDMFFWHFESRQQPWEDPLILYISGGPGTSAMAALGGGMGPCNVGANVTWNVNSWNGAANLLFIDQPFGTGFSTGIVPNNSLEAADDIVKFMEQVVEVIPKFKRLVVAGDSYAGHIVPLVGYALVFKPWARLDSVIVGSGWIDPPLQIKAMHQIACRSKTPLVEKKRCLEMEAYTRYPLLEKCAYHPRPECVDLWELILKSCMLQNHDMGDLRLSLRHTNHHHIQAFFQRQNVNHALGINFASNFSIESDLVYDTFYDSGDK
ncbi:hypothetical protein DSO57_1035417 [Entomophthora muscae]|uniref:Uncharacterized protein n=1 Tax=Entomophthora muscae TaxID=34485 RepID=A0ACC2S1H4_9FUNG|nr:hypothetical protein DSO57_1035417 [Entomophthora muscae]